MNALLSEPGYIRSVVAADVYKAGRLAAQLLREPSGVEFRYLPGYVEIGGRPVARSLPLSNEPLITPAGAVPPFFAGLLPEGRRLSNLRRAIKTSADDEFSLVLAVGSDPVGDVQIVPEGVVPADDVPLLDGVTPLNELRFADLLSDAGIVDPSALAGVQDKASARGLSVPVGTTDDRFILKLDPPEFPHIVANEAYFLSLARSAGLPTVDATVVTDIDGRTGLVVRRFDRLPGTDGSVQRLEVEDACQLLGRWPADKYNVRAEVMTSVVVEACTAGPVAARDVFAQLVFAWLTGNGDVHAKNISVLTAVGGECRVAPAYDLPSTAPYGDRTLALSMTGRADGLSRRRLLEFAAAIGLRERAAVRVVDDLLDATAGVIDDLRGGALPFNDRTITDTVAVLRNRRQLTTG